MQSDYYVLEVLGPSSQFWEELSSISELAMSDFACLGVEEYSLEEAEVDGILGERSYGGGNPEPEAFRDVEQYSRSDKGSVKFYFSGEEASHFQEYLRAYYPDLEIVVSTHATEDWNQSWRKNFKRIDVEGFSVIPSWEVAEDQKLPSHSILIYPGQGFGTGNHETTYLCLKRLVLSEDMIAAQEVLDYGCGSGILGLAYLRLNGRGSVDLLDIDKEALENCRHNLNENARYFDVSRHDMFLDQSKLSHKKYDLVFANVILNVLLTESPFLIRSLKDNAHLVVSGVLDSQETELLACFQDKYQLSLIAKEQKNDWMVFVFRKEK